MTTDIIQNQNDRDDSIMTDNNDVSLLDACEIDIKISDNSSPEKQIREAIVYNSKVQSLTYKVEAVFNDVLTGTYLSREGSGYSSIGFMVYGKSGTGKTYTMHEVLNHYPCLITHQEDDKPNLQIPYLYIQCIENNSIRHLYRSIVREIDITLNNGNHIYEEDVVHTKTINEKAVKICSYLEDFNVGCVIIDNAECLDETVLIRLIDTIAGAKAGIGLIGTTKILKTVISKPQYFKRFVHIIDSEKNSFIPSDILHPVELSLP